MLSVLSTQRDHPAFEFPVREIQESGSGPVGKAANGQWIQAVGRGWGLMTVDQANEFRQKWNIK